MKEVDYNEITCFFRAYLWNLPAMLVSKYFIIIYLILERCLPLGLGPKRKLVRAGMSLASKAVWFYSEDWFGRLHADEASKKTKSAVQHK